MFREPPGSIRAALAVVSAPVVESTDGYRVSVAGYQRADHYDFTLSGSSPCIGENGSPDPRS
ncbi:hypothetical protein [Actinoplanes rectilineatus]|uniref:hypothetical protein n=1 Tax=Actinoplanes rectilineatus TaxID=113571 RepID=UPI0005F299B9|nr:hypothetical protein [Actinoplanes rectilineatus]